MKLFQIILSLSSLHAAFAWHIAAVIYSLYQKIKADNENQPVVAYYVETERDPYKV